MLLGARARWARRAAVACVLVGVFMGLSSGYPAVAAMAAVVAAGFELVRRLLLRELDEPTRALIADDARARRFTPSRWNWRAATRVRPWWWVILQRTSPPKALCVNAGAFVLATARHSTPWTILLALALPFSVIRAHRWWRRTHPSKRSWSPHDH